MFLRAHSRSKDGKQHRYWSLVETVRTPDGPRQRTLCYLGELNDSAQARWLKTIEVFNENGEAQQLKLFPSDVEPPANDPDVAQVVLKKVRLERTRQLGPCYLGWQLFRRLKLDEFFASTIDTDGADVAWSRVAAIQVAVKEQSGQLSLEWSAKEGQQQWREAREGAYLLRTNLTATTAAELWEKYMQLTEVEAAFRALKSELSIRPLFHQLEHRVKVHVMVAFLGYALWVTLKHLLAAKGSEWSQARALAELATLQSADIILPTTDGHEIRLRRVTEPTAEQKKLLNQLGIELPDQLQLNQHVVQTSR